MELESHWLDIWQSAEITATSPESDISAVISLPDKAWKETHNRTRNISPVNFNDTAHWLRVQLSNFSNETELVLLNQYNFVRSFDAYLITDGKIQHYQGGNEFTIFQKENDFFKPSLNLAGILKQTSTLYIRYDSPSSVIAIPILGSNEQIRYQLLIESLGGIIFAAMMLMFICFNLVIAIFSRQKRFIFASLYISLLMLYLVIFEGFDRLAFPYLVNFETSTMFATIAISAVLSAPALFMITLFKLNDAKVWFGLCAFSLFASLAIIVVIFITNVQLLAVLSSISLISQFVLLIYTLFLLIKRNQKQHLFLVVAWLLHIVCLSTFYAMLEGQIPYSWLSYHSIHLSSLIVALVFSATLAFQIRSTGSDANNDLFELYEDSTAVKKSMNFSAPD